MEERYRRVNPEYVFFTLNYDREYNDMNRWSFNSRENLIEKGERPWLFNNKTSLISEYVVDREIKENTQPIFLFHKLQGRTRGINTVYDSAASALVTTHAIPGNELKAAERKMPDITIQGLGSSIKDVRAWDLLLPLQKEEQKKQQFIYSKGFSVKEILKHIEVPNLKEAHLKVKREKPSDMEIQRSKEK